MYMLCMCEEELCACAGGACLKVDRVAALPWRRLDGWMGLDLGKYLLTVYGIHLWYRGDWG